MKKLIILGILCLFLMSGCGQITGESVKEFQCNKPYIQVGSECCLDENENNVCDRDENIADFVVGEEDKISFTILESLGNKFCSSVKSSIGCYCDNDKCNLGITNSYGGEDLSVKQIKISVEDNNGNIIFEETKDINLRMFLPEPIILEKANDGDKVKMTITKIKYGDVVDYDCEITKEAICKKE